MQYPEIGRPGAPLGEWCETAAGSILVLWKCLDLKMDCEHEWR